MASMNFYGEGVFADAQARDRAIREMEDYVQATQGTFGWDNVHGYAAGSTPINMMHYGDSDGPGLRWSYVIPYEMQDDWSTSVYQPYVVQAALECLTVAEEVPEPLRPST